MSPKFFTFEIDSFTRNDRTDMVVNLCGLIPFGFFLVALLAAVTPVTQPLALEATIAIGFTLSVGIELTQAWIPSRSSSLLDLLLNVVGVGIGAAACTRLAYVKKPDV